MKLLIYTVLIFVGCCFFLGDCLGQGVEVDTSGLNQLSYDEFDSLLNMYHHQRAYRIMMPIVNKALEKVKRELGEKDSTYAWFLTTKAYLHEESAQYEKAEKYYLKVKENYQLSLDSTHIGHVMALESLGHLYGKMGRYKQAEILLCQAVNKCKNPYPRLLRNLAYAKTDMGKYQEAEKVLLQTKDMLDKTTGEQDREYPALLNELAALYNGQRKYEKATLLFLQAQEILKKKEDKKSYSNSLSNLGLLYIKTNKLKESEKILLKCLEIDEEEWGKKHFQYSFSLNNLATLYSKMKRYEEAEKLLLKVKQIRKRTLGEMHPYYGATLSSLAKLYIETGSFKQAKIIYLEIEAIAKVAYGGKHHTYSICLNNLAYAYCLINQIDTAFFYCMASIMTNTINFNTIFPDLFFQTNNSLMKGNQYEFYLHFLEPSIFLNLSSLKWKNPILSNIFFNTLLHIIKKQYRKNVRQELLWKNNKLQVYYNICKAAMVINEQVRSDFLGRASKLRLLKENGIFAKNGIETALELGTLIHYAEAFSFAEQNKSMLLADFLRGNKAQLLGNIPDSLIIRELDLHYQYDILKKKKYNALSIEDSIKVVREENELNITRRKFQELIKKNYSKYYAYKYKNVTATANEIQDIINPKTLFLEYYVADSAIYLFSLTKDSIQIHKSPIAKALLQQKTAQLHQALSDYAFIRNQPKTAREQYTKTAHWFYQNLVAPALDNQKNIKQLIIVPDHSLNHIPFEVFLSQATDTLAKDYKSLHYLLRDYNISYNYSATLLKENIKNTPKQTNNKLLACAGHYTHQDSSLLKLRKPHLINQRNKFTQLKSAEQEVAYLRAGFEGDFLIAKNANERSFKTIAQNYGVIHLAMHGRSDTLQPILSSLIFTEDQDSIEDNFLQAYEISRLDLQAQLVVLSACETGYGVFEQGEGVLSLARSFMYAGVPSLVVSLWSVDDVSTAMLMKSFYNYLAEGLPKDEALRLAKLDFFEQEDERLFHPFFWASFIQLGTTQPILLARKKTSNWYYFIATILAVIGCFIWHKKRITRKNEKI